MSSNEPRDQLAHDLKTVHDRHSSLNYYLKFWADDVAPDLIALGWRPPPRVIETSEELDALPVGAVVRDRDGSVCERGPADLAHYTGTEMSGDWSYILLPATVLYEPEEVGR